MKYHLKNVLFIVFCLLNTQYSYSSYFFISSITSEQVKIRNFSHFLINDLKNPEYDYTKFEPEKILISLNAEKLDNPTRIALIFKSEHGYTVNYFIIDQESINFNNCKSLEEAQRFTLAHLRSEKSSKPSTKTNKNPKSYEESDKNLYPSNSPKKNTKNNHNWRIVTRKTVKK